MLWIAPAFLLVDCFYARARFRNSRVGAGLALIIQCRKADAQGSHGARYVPSNIAPLGNIPRHGTTERRTVVTPLLGFVRWDAAVAAAIGVSLLVLDDMLFGRAEPTNTVAPASFADAAGKARRSVPRVPAAEQVGSSPVASLVLLQLTRCLITAPPAWLGARPTPLEAK